MDSIERLENVLKGEPVDRPPFSFWHHYGVQHMSGEAVASVHIAFARKFDVDFIKVMNDYPYPIREGVSMDRVSDILQMKPLRGIEGCWSHQLIALKNIQAAFGKQKWIVDTIYSPWTILGRLVGIDNLIKTAGSRPQIIKYGLEVITSSLIGYIKEAAPYINGIYFSLTEADYDHFNPLEHYNLCFKYNKMILETADQAMREQKKTPFTILRLKGHRVFFESVKEYPSAAASWEHFRTRPGLAKGLVSWQRPILGGIDGENLHHYTPGIIRERFEKYSDEYMLKGLIVAPTCSLRTNVSPYLLEAVTAGVNSLVHTSALGKRVSIKEMSRMPGMERDLGSSLLRSRERKPAVSDAETKELEEDFKRRLAASKGLPVNAGDAEPAASSVQPAPDSSSPETGRMFSHDVDFSALASEAEGDNVDVASYNTPAQPQTEPEEDLKEAESPADAFASDNDAFVPDIDLDDIDDIYEDDFGEYAGNEQDDADGAPSASSAGSDYRSSSAVDKPRQAWRDARREGSADSRRRYDRRRDYNDRADGYRNEGRSRRNGQGEWERRSSYGNYEQRGGYGESRRSGRYGGGASQGGYGERESRHGQGKRERRNGAGSRDHRGGSGKRDHRGGGGYRERSGGYGQRDERRGFGGREGRGGFGGRERQGGYADRSNYSDRSFHDSGRRVVRIKKQR